MPKTLLLEIGAEELPSSFVDAALAAMPGLVKAKLEALRLAHGDIRALGTPRRLALLVHGVAEKQPDLDEEVVGPPETAGFKDGKPTKAAEAFAQKLGIAVDQIQVTERAAAGKQKAGRYLTGRRKEQGRDARELLGKALAELAAEIPFRKSMRWGAGDATFGRPVQWLVALFGDEQIDVSFAGVRSGKKTKGHRFLAPATVEIANADAYVETLRKAHVLVDRDEREKSMMERVAAAAKAAGGDYDPEPSLVSENASLVEEPFVVTGSYESQFLALPAAVVRSVARGHQKYFVVQKSEAELIPKYLAVVNTANDPPRIAKGMDNVMRARLSDARFFYEEDKRAKIEDRVEKLAGIVFHNRLGTVREKVARMEKLATKISSNANVARAAHICKFDLVSLMVGEFPELQGEMGRDYALHAGEPAEVANAVRDHYRPIGAEGALPTDDVSAAVALADRVDTLVGCFAVGLSPTGSADPFSLRRACIATLRILLDRPTHSLTELLGWAYDGFEGKKLDLSKEDTTKKLLDFTSERLRGLLGNATTTAVADTVMAGGGVEWPSHAMARAKAVHRAVTEGRAWLEKARIVAKRLAGISKESKPVLHLDLADHVKPTDDVIVEVVRKVDGSTKELVTEAAVAAALAQAEELAQRLDEVFNSTLVNDPNDARTPKRLELLSYGAQCMLRIGDFSKLG